MRNNNSKMGLSSKYVAIPTIFLMIGKGFAKHPPIILWSTFNANYASVTRN